MAPDERQERWLQIDRELAEIAEGKVTPATDPASRDGALLEAVCTQVSWLFDLARLWLVQKTPTPAIGRGIFEQKKTKETKAAELLAPQPARRPPR
jgi:hypothetical protein